MASVLRDVLLARDMCRRPKAAILSEALAEVAPGKHETGILGAVLQRCCSTLYHAGEESGAAV
jgi:hypothetical protein